MGWIIVYIRSVRNPYLIILTVVKKVYLYERTHTLTHSDTHTHIHTELYGSKNRHQNTFLLILF